MAWNIKLRAILEIIDVEEYYFREVGHVNL
jgi:hypothetical protein